MSRRLVLRANSTLGELYVTEDNYTFKRGLFVEVPDAVAERILRRYPAEFLSNGDHPVAPDTETVPESVSLKLLEDTLLEVPFKENGIEFQRGSVNSVPKHLAETLLIKYPREFIVVDGTQQSMPKCEVPHTEFIETEVGVRITVVMPTYNQSRYIKRAIDSILAQTYKNFKLVIVDDCSTDDTIAIVQSYDDARIVLITREKNGGTGAALNDGFKIAEGDYGTWFSSDNWAEPEYLMALKNALDGNPDIGLVYGDCNILDLAGQIKTLYVGKEFDREKLYSECYLGIAFLYRLDLKKKCGDYDLRPCEDYDMALRMVELTDFKRVPMMLATWRDHKESVTHKVNMPNKWENHFRCIRDAKARRALNNGEIFCVLQDKPNSKLKVAHIHPWWDAAGVGIQHCEFMSSLTEISIRHIMGGNTCLAHDEDLIIGRDNKEIERVLQEADILHFNTYCWNEDKSVYTGMPNFNFLRFLDGKKVIFHLHGGEWVFRPKKLMEMVNSENLHLLSCSPLIPQFYPGMKWMPNIMNINDKLHLPIERNNALVKFVYTVNYLYNKGKDAVDATFDWMKKYHYAFEYESWVRKYALRECLMKRKHFDVTIDQMTQGFIGMVGWEAMSHGQAVLARLDPKALEVYTAFAENEPPPIINVCGIEGLSYAVFQLLKDREYLRHVQLSSREWMEKHYSVAKLVNLWEEYYRSVAENARPVSVPTYLFTARELE